jgi:hypothetical protein
MYVPIKKHRDIIRAYLHAATFSETSWKSASKKNLSSSTSSLGSSTSLMSKFESALEEAIQEKKIVKLKRELEITQEAIKMLSTIEKLTK